MPSQGPLIAHTAAGNGHWSANPGTSTLIQCIQVKEAVAPKYAEHGADTDLTYLYCTNFGFAIPTGAAIQGVVVLVNWANGAGATVQDHVGKIAARLMVGGAPTGNEKEANGVAADPIAFQDQIFGDPSDLWGCSLSAAAVNSSGFGLAVRRGPTSNESGPVGRAVNYVEVTVYYSDPVLTVPQLIGAMVRHIPPYGLQAVSPFKRRS